MKKYTITGKSVFRDNQTGLFYVDLNSGMRITVENNPDRKSTRLNSSHVSESRMPSSA